MSISSFLQTHKELDKIQKEFQTLKSYNSRFQTLLKLRPESFSGLSADQLEKTWIKRHTKKMYLCGPHKVKIQKDCILDLAFLTSKSRRTIERGVNTFFKKNFNLQNCSHYSRDWLTFKLTNLKEIENLKKEKRKRKRKEKGKEKGKGRDDKEKEKRKCKRAQARKKRRKRKYQLEMSDLGNENLLVTDLQANDHSTQNDKNQKKTKMKSSNEHYNKRKCKLGHFRNRSRNDTCHKKPKLKLKLKSELTPKCKRKLKLKTPILIAKEKNTQSNDSKIKNFRNRKELNLLDLKEKKIKNEYFETNTTTPLEKETNNYFQTNNQNQNENEYGYEHEYEYEHDHKQDHEQEENGLMKLEDNNQILDSENFDIYTYYDSNSSSSLGDIFGFSYDENENENQTLNKDNNKFDQIYIIETEQSLNDGELAADIEFINSQEEDIVLSEKDLKFLRNDLSIEKQMNEKFDIFFQNDESFLLLNEPNDPLEC
ncbi:l10-interacting myb domain-containing protein-like [Anaeramoeba flamelloides]|uniref:L10-interacting myb domain-containing protein-like n=1 Tax=Anaeramoeba flamelloides TaxID=1746091 RepID=A0AAV7ZXU6_9EUKA|nr:l10-interacting myb domain-containing protein-like [Anaeramoeba flamelloides]